MMEADTALDPRTALPDIAEQLEDTPNSVAQEPQLFSGRTIARRLAPLMLTPLLAIPDPFMASQDMTHSTEAEHIVAPSMPPFDLLEHGSQDTEADVHNRTRLELLAREYVVGKLSPEEEARLVIVTERVRRLIPRVTAEDFEMLERIFEDAAQIEAEDIERRRRLGIE
jgi:hypothetical protein